MEAHQGTKDLIAAKPWNDHKSRSMVPRARVRRLIHDGVFRQCSPAYELGCQIRHSIGYLPYARTNTEIVRAMMVEFVMHKSAASASLAGATIDEETGEM